MLTRREFLASSAAATLLPAIQTEAKPPPKVLKGEVLRLINRQSAMLFQTDLMPQPASKHQTCAIASDKTTYGTVSPVDHPSALIMDFPYSHCTSKWIELLVECKTGERSRLIERLCFYVSAMDVHLSLKPLYLAHCETSGARIDRSINPAWASLVFPSFRLFLAFDCETADHVCRHIDQYQSLANMSLGKMGKVRDR